MVKKAGGSLENGGVLASGKHTHLVNSRCQPKRYFSRRQRIIQIAPILASLLGGASLMIIHHMFYAHLNHKRIDSGATELPTFLMSQKNVNFIGNFIAHGARIILGMAIGATFSQLFWETLRSRSHTLAQIDALVNCEKSPFHLSALQAAKASLTLYVVSVAISATALVVVVSPGALTVSTSAQRTRPCIVPTVPQEVASSNYDFVGGLSSSFLNSMLVSGTYIPPFQDDLAHTCGSGFSSCSYNVSFVGPTLDCIDITNKTDFTSFLEPHSFSEPTVLTQVWNASVSLLSTSIKILSRDPAKDLVQATNCTAYNATYTVGVSLAENAIPMVQVWSVTRDNKFLLDNSFMSYYASETINQLAGNCFVGATQTLVCNPNGPSLGSLLLTTATGNFTFGDAVPHFLTSLFQNTSISLLSGVINYGFTNDTAATNLQYVNSTCSSPVTIYSYNAIRLLLSYGAITTVATALVIVGCRLISDNGVEGNILVSDLIQIALNDDVIDIGEKTSEFGRTSFQLLRTDLEHQKLIAIPRITSRTGLEDPPRPTKAPSDEVAASPGRKSITAAHWKMTILILATACVLVLNHSFYRYVEGKRPSLHLSGSSEWALNQSVVSGIGITLAYAGQTFLAIATSVSFNQVFWRDLRKRGYSISRVDTIANTRTSYLSILPALRTSLYTSLLALLPIPLASLSIFAPASIRVASNFKEVKECAALAPRNLTTLVVDTTVDKYTGGNESPLRNIFATGTYLPPIDVCDSSTSDTQCSYKLQFMGPALECEEGVVSNNYSDFKSQTNDSDFSGWTNLFQAAVLPRTIIDPAMRIFVQVWDTTRSTYQAANCTGIIRSYSISISHTVVDVTKSKVIAANRTSTQQLEQQQLTFAENFMNDMMTFLVKTSLAIQSIDGSEFFDGTSILPSTGGIGNVQLNGQITWRADLAAALEEFSQNATLSIFSGQVLTMSSVVPDILENVTTTCTYTFTAYEYTPAQLLLTYGVCILVTILCAIWGSIAIHKNGVEETMDFSRMLRAISNERMFNVRNTLNKDSIIKAEDTLEGSFIPLES
ncbi:hypothetical protein SCHPADRAFT_937671 [Schizopora paradoxa]|uniref:Transmembrane protein n=1 Tax=Schizopora paradoxa TaxID=27342 RepID=A0A0H2RY20_9AGAM|nr:hypothetical protein SCHPADRAFT_937671 [Schizopora paradoxa]